MRRLSAMRLPGHAGGIRGKGARRQRNRERPGMGRASTGRTRMAFRTAVVPLMSHL
ncbi:hypothetical protein GCM10010255_58660 [Streptomyces coeruleofuscus]|uniref:Uncharacterized protein n=1 Tax=Streptomyces coeruleofuscus TaxID=66879 RepID=A0ABP5VYB6_9ACTN